MKRSLWAVVLVPVAFALVVGLAAWRTSSGPDIGVCSAAAIDPAYPQDTLTDLVSYNDQVSVVKVVSERRIREGSEEESGGMEFRDVTVQVEDTIWHGPSNATAP